MIYSTDCYLKFSVLDGTPGLQIDTRSIHGAA